MRSIAQGGKPSKGAIRLIKGGLGYMVKGQTSKGGNNPPPTREAGDIKTALASLPLDHVAQPAFN